MIKIKENSQIENWSVVKKDHSNDRAFFMLLAVFAKHTKLLKHKLDSYMIKS